MAIRTHVYLLKTYGMGRLAKDDSPAARRLIADIRGMVDEYDADERAYYDTRRLVFDWQEKNGDERRSMSRPTNRSNALYWYRQALKYGDLAAAEKYIKRYYELGGTPATRMQSIRRAHPLSGLPPKDRYRWRQSLTKEEAQAVERGIQWYRNTYTSQRTGDKP